MKSVAASNARGGRRKQSRKPTTESRQPRGRRREKSTSQQVDKSTAKPKSSCLQASRPSSLDAAALADIVEELRVIDHTLSCAPGLAEEARVVVNASECDEPARRDPIAKISLRLMGVDVDRIGARSLRLPNDPLIESIVDAADAVIEAARWRLDRVRCVLARAGQNAESRNAESRNAESRE